MEIQDHMSRAKLVSDTTTVLIFLMIFNAYIKLWFLIDRIIPVFSLVTPKYSTLLTPVLITQYVFIK